MEDKEFLSLDLDSAREYALAWATTVKRYDQDIAAIDQDLALWRGRVKLAADKGQAELASAAESRCAELAAKREALVAERAPVASDLVRLKERIPYLKARVRSVDPDLLLAELQSMTGTLLDPESAAAEAGIQKLTQEAGAEDALAELKKKMGGS